MSCVVQALRNLIWSVRPEEEFVLTGCYIDELVIIKDRELEELFW